MTIISWYRLGRACQYQVVFMNRWWGSIDASVPGILISEDIKYLCRICHLYIKFFEHGLIGLKSCTHAGLYYFIESFFHSNFLWLPFWAPSSLLIVNWLHRLLIVPVVVGRYLIGALWVKSFECFRLAKVCGKTKGASPADWLVGELITWIAQDYIIPRGSISSSPATNLAWSFPPTHPTRVPWVMPHFCSKMFRW